MKPEHGFHTPFLLRKQSVYRLYQTQENQRTTACWHNQSHQLA